MARTAREEKTAMMSAISVKYRGKEIMISSGNSSGMPDISAGNAEGRLIMHQTCASLLISDTVRLKEWNTLVKKQISGPLPG